MPEICEAETIARNLEGVLRRNTLIGWGEHVGGFLKNGSPRDLLGWTVSSVGRIGKSILFRFENPGIGSRYALSRLGMTGYWTVHRSGAPELTRTSCLTLEFKGPLPDGGWDAVSLVYHDKRRFGSFHVADNLKDLTDMLNYGQDVLSETFTADYVWFCLHKHRMPVKAILMRPEYFPGFGNWVSNEVLFASNVNPACFGVDLERSASDRIATACVRVVKNGISQGGATIRDFMDPDGLPGRAQDFFNIYGRQGKPCYVCQTPIVKSKIAGRGTYHCPVCQSADWQPKPEVPSDFVVEAARAVGLL